MSMHFLVASVTRKLLQFEKLQWKIKMVVPFIGRGHSRPGTKDYSFRNFHVKFSVAWREIDIYTTCQCMLILIERRGKLDVLTQGNKSLISPLMHKTHT